MQVVAYVPASAARDIDKHLRKLAAQCRRDDHEIVHVTTDPAEARRWADEGRVEAVAAAEPEHLTHVYPVLLPHVVRQRRLPGGAVVVGAGVTAWGWARRRKAVAVPVAVLTAAGIASAAMFQMLGQSPDGEDLADPPPVVAPSPSASEPTVTPSPTPSVDPTPEPTDPPVADEQPPRTAGSPDPSTTAAPAEPPGNGGEPPGDAVPGGSEPGPSESSVPPTAATPPAPGPPPGAGPPPGIPPAEPPPTDEPPGTAPGPEPDPDPDPSTPPAEPEPERGDGGGLICLDLDLPPLLRAGLCIL